MKMLIRTNVLMLGAIAVVSTWTVAFACTFGNCTSNKCTKYIDRANAGGLGCTHYSAVFAFAPNVNQFGNTTENTNGTFDNGTGMQASGYQTCCRKCLGNAGANDAQDGENMSGLVGTQNITQEVCSNNIGG